MSTIAPHQDWPVTASGIGRRIHLVARSQLDDPADRARFDDVFLSLPLRLGPARSCVAVADVDAAVFRLALEQQAAAPLDFWLALDAPADSAGPLRASLTLGSGDAARAVARIGASVSASPLLRGKGFVGFFECEEAHAAAGVSLVRHASAWLEALRSESAVRAGHTGTGPDSQWRVQDIFGPVNFATWFPYRFRDDAHLEAEPSKVWEPRNPAFYIEIFQQAGLQRAPVEYSSIFFGVTDAVIDISRFIMKDPIREKIVVRPFRMDPVRMAVHEDDVAMVARVMVEAYSGKFLFDETLSTARVISKIFFDGLLHSTPEIRDSYPKLSSICFDLAGNPVGFYLSYVDSGFVVLKTIGIVKGYVGSGMHHIFVDRALVAGRALGARGVCGALVTGMDGPLHMVFGKQNVISRHTYSVFHRKAAVRADAGGEADAATAKL